MKIVKNLVLLLVCAALIVPAVLLVTGKLPYKIYVVHTGSMIPTIPPKSAVIVKEGVYHVGQVISFHTVNGIVTHRLVKRNADGTLVTKGDGNRTVDPGAPCNPPRSSAASWRRRGWSVTCCGTSGSRQVWRLPPIILCVWLMWSLAAEYAKRGQRTTRGLGRARRSSAARPYRSPSRVALRRMAAGRGCAGGLDQTPGAVRQPRASRGARSRGNG